jgi:ubiquitin conjugation factor E4 B
MRFSKQHLIHDHYLLLSDRIDVADDTRINADKTMVDEFTKTLPSSPSFNFVTEIFYLTLSYHHYGTLSIIRHNGNMTKQIQRMKEQLDKLVSDRDRGAFDGPIKVLFEERLKKFQLEYENMVGGKLAFDAILIDKHSIEHSIRFYNLAMVWILRCAFSDTVAPEKMKSIDWGSLLRGNAQDVPVMNLTVEPPRLFAIIPEWILDDICEFYLYVLRYWNSFYNERRNSNVRDRVRPMYFEQISRDEITTFAMIFLQNSNYIKNPYLKSKFVEILFHFTHSLYQDASGRTFGKLDDVFVTHPLARESLVKCLMTFYVGMHFQM